MKTNFFLEEKFFRQKLLPRGECPFHAGYQSLQTHIGSV